MAGIYSQGGSAGHRYAGWLSKVEAKNFHFGGKVFNGSPSAIYVGSKMVWSKWLNHAAFQAIMAAFGVDGKAVIAATNEYLNGIAASDNAKATALAGFINEDPMMVCCLGLTVEGVTFPTREIIGDGVAYMITDIYIKDTWAFETDAYWTDNYNTSQAFEGIFAPDWNMAWGRYTGRGYIYFISGSSGNQPHPDFYSNTLYKVRIDGTTKKFIVNGTSYNMAGTPTGALSPVTFGLFTPNRPAEQFNPSVYWMIAKKTYAKFYDENGVLKDSLVPCKHKVNGVLEAGMVDLETAHWFGNANSSGSFTIPDISYTPTP